MKKLLILILGFLSFGFLHAQGGLDGIIVEKYYEANAADAAASIGALPVGSVTYRLYVDMKPGYELVSMYGQTDLANNKLDTLKFQTTTTFFNNEDRGSLFSYNIGNAFLDDNTVMLDSWFTTGRIGAGYQGIAKADDTNGSILSASSIYNNTPASIGVPVKTQDGLMTPATANVWTPTPGFDVLLDGIFGATSQASNGIVTADAALGMTTPLAGPVPATNRVLIGQFTTDGFFSYQLNLSIREVISGIAEEWVARTPQAGQFSHPDLIRVQNVLPTISITAPLAGAAYTAGQTITVNATAADPNGTVTKVDFIYNGTRISDNAPSYTADFVAASGVSQIIARAFDNAGDSTTAIVNISVGANAAPVVTLGAFPAQNYNDSTVVLTATATDADGIASLNFYHGTTLIGAGVLNAGVYSITWNTTGLNKGNYVIKAEATDNLGASANDTRTITLLSNSGNKYEIREVVERCNNETICVPIASQQQVAEVIGYDIVLKYNTTKVVPSGVIRKGTLANPSLVETSYSINNAQGKMLISVYFNTNAPDTTRFEGLGDIICVEFIKRPAFSANDNVEFTVESLQESYITGVQSEDVDTNSFITYKDTLFSSLLYFWADGSPISYVAGSNLITNIFGTSNAGCSSKSATSVTPDANGEFTHNLNRGLFLSIERNIAAATDVQPVINGFDALSVRKVLIEDISFVPTIYQMIAMDVNMDGVISAGDASQINQRAILKIDEFRQAWNYDDAGNNTGGASKDWLFVNETKPFIYPEYSISAIYPKYDGVGYNKDHVPTLDFCMPTPVSDWTRCAVIGTESYVGILLGDANGNYMNVMNNPDIRTADQVKAVLDVTSINNNEILLPVSFEAGDEVNALDLALKFNQNKLKFKGIVSATDGVEKLAYFNENDETLRVTSNSLQSMNTELVQFYISFEVLNDRLSASDFDAVGSYLNGEAVTFNVIEEKVSGNNDVDVFGLEVYPNPAKNLIYVVSGQDAIAELIDMNSKSVFINTKLTANDKQAVDVSSIPAGVYLLKVSNGYSVSTKKVILID